MTIERENEASVIDAEVTTEPDLHAAEIVRETPRALARPATGGVVVYAAVAGAASVVPVPFVDAILAKLARGSAMRRVAARRGVRLTPEGRAVLARPGLSSPLGSAPARLLRSAITRALTPIRIASRIEDATATFLSALLLDHYLATSDRRVGAPLGELEATIVRSAMEQAWADSGLEALRTVPVGIAELIARAAKAAFQLDTEGRGPVERFVDALLDGAADAPDDLVQRMRDHFDAAIAARSGELAR
ncbi:hypothetical protein [Sandaracinus amylolyticus]|uniref:hypothetical protein n=1 Tax=Sandaracinus amylolyticus TaxID=927083 RepID=UPI001F392263|nr:hypothetical protein [Sandaracinus amylolyticus]UJR80619.1 Hypothetical protein I5071_26660 [Sandaracinus amylolyticus]